MEKGEKVVAALPYYNKKLGIFKGIGMPPLTQNIGIWIKYPDNQKYLTKLGFEKEVVKDCINL